MYREAFNAPYIFSTLNIGLKNENHGGNTEKLLNPMLHSRAD